MSIRRNKLNCLSILVIVNILMLYSTAFSQNGMLTSNVMIYPGVSSQKSPGIGIHVDQHLTDLFAVRTGINRIFSAHISATDDLENITTGITSLMAGVSVNMNKILYGGLGFSYNIFDLERENSHLSLVGDFQIYNYELDNGVGLNFFVSVIYNLSKSIGITVGFDYALVFAHTTTYYGNLLDTRNEIVDHYTENKGANIHLITFNIGVAFITN